MIAICQIVLVFAPQILGAWKLRLLARLALDLQNVALYGALPALQIAVFPVTFFIVLAGSSIWVALRESLNLWQHHWRRLLTLLFPLLAVAMVLLFAHRVGMFCLTRPAARVAFGVFLNATEACISALWMAAVVAMVVRIRRQS